MRPLRPGPAAPTAVLVVILASSCSSQGSVETPVLGVDLSYVNEVEACGGSYHDSAGRTDPFEILSAQGANLARARLWNDPEWTEYGDLDDVSRTFRRARDEGMSSLLDFHYSDDWADPGRQDPPTAWAGITEVDQLAEALGAYTRDTLTRLDERGLLPDIVQIGNEINGGLVKEAVGLDWGHDGPLLEAGIAAVREVAAASGSSIEVMLHVAQPENALPWFAGAEEAGITDFDLIGLSYYPQWSQFSIEELASTVQRLGSAYDKGVVIAETGYPWTTEDADDTADNVLDQGLRRYPLTPEGQSGFMSDLTAAVVANGGMGTIYWEPAWLSTGCNTQWGQGSHWDNATLFDFDGGLHQGAGYLDGDYRALTPERPVDAVPDPEGDSADVAADLTGLAAAMDQDGLGVSLTLAGDPADWAGSFDLAISTAPGGGDAGRHPIAFDDASRPEWLVESSFHGEPGVGYVSTVLSQWSGSGWDERTFTGSVTVEEGEEGRTSVAWDLPGAVLGDIDEASIAGFSVDRGRAGGLADAVGEGSTAGQVAAVVTVGEVR